MKIGGRDAGNATPGLSYDNEACVKGKSGKHSKQLIKNCIERLRAKPTAGAKLRSSSSRFEDNLHTEYSKIRTGHEMI